MWHRMKGDSLSRVAILFLVAALFVTVAASAPPGSGRDTEPDISLSTPTTVGPNETISILTVVQADSDVAGNLTVYNETKTVASFSYGPGTGEAEYTFSSGTLDGGTYNVSVLVANDTAGIVLEDTGSFTVSLAASVQPFIVTSHTVTSCPLQEQESAYRLCKQFAVNMTGTNTSTWNPLVGLSESGTIHTGNITGRGGGSYHVRVVDPNTAGEYDTVFIDDDPVFQEQQETDRAEKSFLSEHDTAFSINTTGGEGQLQVFDTGTDHVYLVAPMLDDEYPVRPGADMSFGVFATADGTPVAGYGIQSTLRTLTGETTDVSPTPADTNAVGLANVSTISDIQAGKYRLAINDEYSSVFKVKQFDISYQITNPSSGTQQRTFKPGDRVQVEVYPTQGGEKITADSTDITVILPDGRVMDVSQEPFTLPENASAGTATVSIEITVNGVTQTVSARFDIKRFKVLTVPLRDADYGPQMTENFAPNSTMYLFASAVKLGTAGGIDDIIHAEFYNLDDPTTGRDECRNTTTMLAGNIGGETVSLNVVGVESIRNSSLFSGISGDLPDGLLNQCVVEAWTPTRSGFFRGNIEVERVGTNDTETGSFTISTSRISVDGSPYSFTGGRWEWTFGPNETMAVRPRVERLRTHTTVPGSNITQGRILELRGPGKSTPVNTSFRNASAGGPLLVFNAPTTAGHYRAKFTVTANVTNSSGMITQETGVGRAFFEVKLFEISADTDSYRKGPDDTVDITATVTTPEGVAKQGATVSVERIRNEETETDYTNRSTHNTNVTNANGVTKLHLTPDSSWGEGWYRVKLKVTDANGKTDYGWTYFRVEQYRTTINKEVNGNSCSWDCSIVTGDNITFTPRIYSYEKDSYVSHTINVSTSSLVYRGGLRSQVREEIPLKNVTISSGGDIHISTDTLSTGHYSLNLHLSVNGNTEIADDFFRINAFAMQVDRAESGWEFGPGQNVTYNVSFETARDATVELDELYTYQDGTQNQYNITKTQTGEVHRLYNGTKHALFNVTVPQNANEDYHSGRLAVTVNGDTQEDYISFDVKTLFAGAPQSFDASFGNTFSQNSDVQADYDSFDTSQDIYPQNKQGYAPCSTYFTETNYSFSGTPPNASCGADDFNTWFDGRLNGLVVDNRTVYVSNDTTFNEAGDAAINLSRHESYTDRHGIGWNLTNADGNPRITVMNYTEHGPCGPTASLYGLTNQDDLSGNNCWVAKDAPLVTATTFRDARYNILVNRNTSRVYISNDTVMGEAGDLAVNSSTGTMFTDDIGMTWNITKVNASDDFWRRFVRLNATNGFANGVIVNPSAADTFVGRGWGGGVPSVDEKGWNLDDTDVNNDGDLNDTLYIIAENNSGTLNAARVSFDNNFSTADGHALRMAKTGGGQVNSSGKHIYLGAFHPGYFGKEVNFYLPHGSGYWRAGNRKPFTNYTFPVRVRYPNGTAVNGATVKIDHIMREYAGVSTTLSSPVRDTTDVNGMAFLTVNLTAGPNASSHLGRYDIVPAVNTSNTDGFKVLDDGPDPDVKLFDLNEDSYLGFETQLDSYDNLTTTEVESTTGLSNLPTGRNKSYRISTNLSESSLGQQCVDVDNDETCGEDTHLVMWEEDSSELTSAAVDRLAIDDDMNFSTEDETKTEEYGDPGIEDPFRPEWGDSLFSSVDALEELEWPGFGFWNESSDMASVYWERDHDFPHTETMTIGFETSELHGSADIANATITLNTVQFNGNTYNLSGVSGSTNSHGTALIPLSPSDVNGHTKTLSLSEGESTTTGIGGQEYTIEVVDVTSPNDVSFKISGTPYSKSKYETLTMNGMTVNITEVVDTGDSSSIAEFTVDEVWPRDETVEVRGNVSTGSGTQTFNVWISTAR